MAAVALPGLQGPFTGSNLAGPRKRSAAGQDIRHGSCNFAGWRLSPYPAYRVLPQAHTSQARASAAPPGKISDTVPVISPGGGCRLTRPTGSSHRLIPVGPRKRSAAGQDIRHGTCNFAGWRLRLARPTESSYRLKPLRPAQAQRRRARYQARYL
ncbi:conserved hypothetical protein [Klebsiella pneumoniae]|nr:conserved hypothetical protein [Klebsiella pneumoniae]